MRFQVTPRDTPTEQIDTELPELICPVDKVIYKCDGSSESYPTNPYTINDDTCDLTSQEIDSNLSWCDIPDLEPNILLERIRKNCCVDREYESNINYLGMAIYLIITVPIIYMFIDKLFNKFIFIDNTEGKSESDIESSGNQFYTLIDNMLGNKYGIKLIILSLVSYYLLLPMFRFFFVSYRCEDVTGVNPESNCSKSCDDDSECITIDNSACSSCINNVCSNPSFGDYDIDVDDSDIILSVCGIDSLLNHLKDEEIDDIYSKFIPDGRESTRVNKENALQSLVSDINENKKLTSYYYRFYPRQEISINDTITPFKIRIPNPDVVGYDYLLNNYLQLEEYPSSSTCSQIGVNLDNTTRQLLCNNNHKCKWDLSSSECVDVGNCPNRFMLPNIRAINAHQTIDDTLDLHNKVYRSGIDYDTSSNSFPDNLYPCNDVVFQSNYKIMAKNNISTPGTPISDMAEWINNFELKREECSDKLGQCYLKDYVCENSKGYPIPLKNLQLGSTRDFTIGDISDKGCQTAMYPCDETNLDSDCLAIVENQDGYIVEVPNGGICKQLTWTNTRGGGTWEESSDDTKQLSYKCVPKDPSTDTITLVGDIRFPNATAPDWVNNKTNVTTKCKAVRKIPRSNIDEINTPDTTISNYYRWNSTANEGNLLCTDWIANPSNTCDSSQTVNHYATYESTDDPSNECCIEVNDDPNSQTSLFITGDLIGDAPSVSPAHGQGEIVSGQGR